MQRRPVFLSVLTHSFLNPGENCRQLLIIYSDVTVVNEQVPPATAPDECLLRTSLMVTHTEDQIEKAVAIIAEVLHKHKIGI